MIKMMLKLAIGVVVVGGAIAAWLFWKDLTPGERYHMVDKARTGDVDGAVDSLKYKAGEQLEREKKKAAEVMKELSDEAVDAAADKAKQKVHDKIDAELKKEEAPQGTKKK